MGKKKKSSKGTASGVPPKKASVFQSAGAVVAGVIAVKLASYIVTTGWRLATRENPPQADEPLPIAKKALWIGLVGAATGAARQAARDFIKPPGGGPA